jgi:drug/metabolite transporter (DMT)-like permease
MRRFDAILLTITALCWGASFMLIKVSIRELDPIVVMVLRCAIGAIPMWLLAGWLRARRGQRPLAAILGDAARRPWALLALGMLTGVPLWLVGVGEQRIDSGLAGVVNASVPLWAALLALRYDRQHRTDSRRIVGVLVGFGGVVLLALARGSIGGGSEAIGVATVAAAGLLYATGAILVRERLGAMPSIEAAAWSITIAAVAFAVPAWMVRPATMPGADVMQAMLALSLLGTFVGFVTYYELLARVGAARATMVTYLLPPLALGYGWALLGERIGLEALAAMSVILLGVWLGTRGRNGPTQPGVEAPAPISPAAAASARPGLRPRPTRPS